METKRVTVSAVEELIGLYFPVLDHGFIGVRDYMGSDASIEGAARGSYAYGNRQKTDQRQLLRYLTRHRHTSPTEFVEVVVHCAMPIAVARQWIRHRTASVSELSGRYSLMPMLFYTPTDEQIKRQSKSNKQGREGELPKSVVWEWTHDLDQSRDSTSRLYEWATENDIARELARIDLPLSTYTVWTWKIDLHNLFHALSLRCDLHAQWETRQYFNVLAGIAKRLAPISFEAWEDYHFYAKTFSRMEMQIIREFLRQPEGFNGLEFGLPKTEAGEFLAKFDEPTYQNFDLDLTQAKPAEFFENKFREAAEG